VHAVAEICATTGTIWENYAPDSVAAGRHVNGEPVVRDMVGWSGIGPILYFLEFGVGLKPDAVRNTLRWEIRSSARCGCERYRFNGHVISLVAIPIPGGKRVNIKVNTDGPFTLAVTHEGTTRSESIPKGTVEMEFP